MYIIPFGYCKRHRNLVKYDLISRFDKISKYSHQKFRALGDWVTDKQNYLFSIGGTGVITGSPPNLVVLADLQKKYSDNPVRFFIKYLVNRSFWRNKKQICECSRSNQITEISPYLFLSYHLIFTMTSLIKDTIAHFTLDFWYDLHIINVKFYHLI